MPRARPDASSATVGASERPTAAAYMLVVSMVISFGGNMHPRRWPSKSCQSADGALLHPYTRLKDFWSYPPSPQGLTVSGPTPKNVRTIPVSPAIDPIGSGGMVAGPQELRKQAIAS